jgi:TonB family protein
MPRRLESGSDPNQDPSATGVLRGEPERTSFESDLGDLRARFAALGGSQELAADLALQIVLNEIVEQTCLATRATGAAIALQRDGEMVCRATSGSTAPELGIRLDTESGLSGLCIKTRQIQRCDDALADERADVLASQRLGVRSVMVMPLLRGEELVGVFEMFSSQPYAFGESEQGTLEVLAGRAVSSLEQAGQPVPPEVPTPTDAETIEEADPENAGSSSRREFDFVTLTLSAAVLICAILLGVAVDRHLNLPKAAHKREVSRVALASAPTSTPAPASAPTPDASSDGGVAQAETIAPPKAAPKSNPKVTVPPGGLMIYEDGKEVFRMSPDGRPEGPRDSRAEDAVKQAAAIEPAADNATDVSAGSADADLIRRVEPEYPEEAREQKIQGPVVLDVRAGRDGSVQHVTLVSGPPLLAEAAVAAVSQWQFKPHKINGHAVGIETRVTMNFRLPE